MPLFRTSTFRSTRVQRVTAGLGAWLLGVLSLLSVWPEGHAWLHGHAGRAAAEHAHGRGAERSCGHEHGDETSAPSLPGAESEEHCIVSLFAHGLISGAAGPFLTAEPLVPAATAAVGPVGPSLIAPRFLQPPASGPPVG